MKIGERVTGCRCAGAGFFVAGIKMKTERFTAVKRSVFAWVSSVLRAPEPHAQARVFLTGRAVTTVGLIGMPATAVLVPLAPQLSEMFFRQPLTKQLRRAARRGSRGGLPRWRPGGLPMRSVCKGGTWQPPSSGGAVPACVCCTAGVQGQRSAFCFCYLLAMFFDRSERRCGSTLPSCTGGQHSASKPSAGSSVPLLGGAAVFL